MKISTSLPWRPGGKYDQAMTLSDGEQYLLARSRKDVNGAHLFWDYWLAEAVLLAEPRTGDEAIFADEVGNILPFAWNDVDYYLSIGDFPPPPGFLKGVDSE